MDGHSTIIVTAKYILLLVSFQENKLQIVILSKLTKLTNFDIRVYSL